MFGLKIFVWVQTFRRVPRVLPCNFCHPDGSKKEFNLNTNWYFSSYLIKDPYFRITHRCSVTRASWTWAASLFCWCSKIVHKKGIWKERNSKEERLKKILIRKIPSLNKVEFSQNWCISKPDLGDQQPRDVRDVHLFLWLLGFDAGSTVVATLCIECNGWVFIWIIWQTVSRLSQSFWFWQSTKLMPFDTVEQNGAAIRRTHCRSLHPLLDLGALCQVQFVRRNCSWCLHQLSWTGGAINILNVSRSLAVKCKRKLTN